MDGGFDFYRERFPIAKKEHKCDCCFETINPGERYSRETGKYDGDFFDRVLCIPCRNSGAAPSATSARLPDSIQYGAGRGLLSC